MDGPEAVRAENCSGSRSLGPTGRGGGRRAPSLVEHLLSAYCVPRAAALRSAGPRPRPAPARAPRTSARPQSLRPVPPAANRRAVRTPPQRTSRDPRGCKPLPTPRPLQRLLDAASATRQSPDSIGPPCCQSFCNAYRLRKAVPLPAMNATTKCFRQETGTWTYSSGRSCFRELSRGAWC